jgi:hypothetical protein
MNVGIQSFVDAMTRAGRKVEVRDPIVLVLVDAPLGCHAGTEVWVGADPPQDFPTIPPHWVHLADSIELAQGGKQASELGAGWAKWSRPHKRWTDGVSPASQWLAHARALLEAATA